VEAKIDELNTDLDQRGKEFAKGAIALNAETQMELKKQVES
jgi:hypothetical protein